MIQHLHYGGCCHDTVVVGRIICLFMSAFAVNIIIKMAADVGWYFEGSP